jgi:PadR family transcriptional regulator, regulatory protein PadR
MSTERGPWASQLRKGVLELAVLGLLDAEPKYGSQLVDELAVQPALEITAGTVYPLLARLAKAGLVTTQWQESPSGPPRKYYALTRTGQEQVRQLAAEFRAVADAMNTVLGGIR